MLDSYENDLKIEHFDLAIDFGWFYFLTKPIFNVLEFIYGYVGNFGWSIILFTVLMRICFFPLAQQSFKSMAKMKKLAPEMQRLKEQYGDDAVHLELQNPELKPLISHNPKLGGGFDC